MLKFADGFDEWLRGPAHRAALDAHDRMLMAEERKNDH